MKAEDPETGETFYFIDMCLPFGASISCALFQEFSDSLQHIVEFLISKNREKNVTNYLDDFLFAALLKLECDRMMQTFIDLCKLINCPLSPEKTEWSTTKLIFLGVLLDGTHYCLIIPEEKRTKALNKLSKMSQKKKATIKEIQELTGLLNFLNRAMVPGRALLRRMYATLKGKVCTKSGTKLKQYHHVNLNSGFREDCEMWIKFLQSADSPQLCRPFVDLEAFISVYKLNFYTDTSGKIGFGCFFDGDWTYGTWSKSFLQMKPSIEYQELFAVCVAVFTWQHKLVNTRVIIFCDNQAVVNMINNSTSACRNCMRLIRMIVLNNLRHNRRIFVQHIRTDRNILADSLSRGKLQTFWDHAPEGTKELPEEIPEELWPVEKLWL